MRLIKEMTRLSNEDSRLSLDAGVKGWICAQELYSPSDC